MNPWGIVLVLLGIVLIMIGFTGTQHKLLSIAKGIPSSARGEPVSIKAAQNQQPTNNPNGPGLV